MLRCGAIATSALAAGTLAAGAGAGSTPFALIRDDLLCACYMRACPRGFRR